MIEKIGDGLEQCGKFIAPEGTFESIPKDNLKGKALKDLQVKRQWRAQQAFEEAELPEIEDTKHWLEDGVFYSIGVYWRNEDEDGDSIFGSFGVEFAPDTDTIVDTWNQ